MLINEAGMVRAIKDAYRSGGYTVYNHGDAVSVHTEDWCVKCEWGVLPRKALAVVVEHIGTIPRKDEPLYVERGEGPQTVFPESVRKELIDWYGAQPERKAAYAPMTICGLQMYQEPEGGRCWGVDPLYLGIVERVVAQKIDADVMSGNHLAWKGQTGSQEAVVLGAVRKTDCGAEEWERIIWKALETMDLHRREN